MTASPFFGGCIPRFFGDVQSLGGLVNHNAAPEVIGFEVDFSPPHRMVFSVLSVFIKHGNSR